MLNLWFDWISFVENVTRFY